MSRIIWLLNVIFSWGAKRFDGLEDWARCRLQSRRFRRQVPALVVKIPVELGVGAIGVAVLVVPVGLFVRWFLHPIPITGIFAAVLPITPFGYRLTRCRFARGQSEQQTLEKSKSV